MFKRTILIGLMALVLFVSITTAGAETLQEDTKIGDVTYPKGIEVGRYGSGKIGWVVLKRPLTIQGMKCTANEEIDFYESGKLKAFRLASQTTIGDIKCPANYGVKLYESGKVWVAPLAESATIQGIKVNSRDFVEFSEDGKLITIMIQHPVEIKEKKYFPNCEIYLDGNGNVTGTKKLRSDAYYR
jgi:hypothetical protein